jgi:hypothetical protein
MRTGAPLRAQRPRPLALLPTANARLRQLRAIGARSHHERPVGLSGRHGDRRRLRRLSPVEAATAMWLIADMTWVAPTAAA